MLLMGCSTAKLSRAVAPVDMPAHVRRRQKSRAGADFEAFGMPLNVLIGGSPAMVGALWDVLGPDLEKVACSLLKDWVEGARSQKQPACDGISTAPKSLMSALVKAREACRLRFLTGAAVVCYGIPL